MKNTKSEFPSFASISPTSCVSTKFSLGLLALKSNLHQCDKVCLGCVLSVSLQVLIESLEMMEHQTKALVMNSDMNQHSTLHNHNQLLLRQQLNAFGRAANELQVTCRGLVLPHQKADSSSIFLTNQWKPCCCENGIPMFRIEWF